MKTSTILMASALAGVGFLFCGATIAAAGPQQITAQAVAAQPTDLSAQSQSRRARTRVLVYPDRQPPFWDYPRPGDVSWPGPGALRECAFRLEPEKRPSGTVIVPRQSCWWVRG